jgi:hypothetical protein
MMTRRWITSALIVTMVSALAPVSSWAGGTVPANDLKTGRLQTAIRQAALAAVATPSLQLHATAPTPASAPAKSGVRKQSTGGGGGHAGMIIGLVTAAAGIGATVYMVKEMEKTTKNLPTQY